MKNVCFIVRDGYDAQYIISALQEKGIDAHFTYILERGGKARGKKLKRMIREQNIFAAFINVCALLVYDHVMTKGMKAICGVPQYPSGCRYASVEDVNDLDCSAAVKAAKPDLILIYGSGILKKEAIANFDADIYNIHSSILPYYRNVHSDFWAYMDDRKDLIGVTIFKLDTGIDTGKIALQRRCELPRGARLYEYKAQNLKNIPGIMEEFISRFFAGQVVLVPQDPNAGSVAQTPNLKDITRFFRQENKKDR